MYLAKVFGYSIGKKDIKWQVISDEEFRGGLVKVGFTKENAEGLTAMNACCKTGVIHEHYNNNKPELDKIKLNDFAIDFAKIYQSNN